ncbi:MAG: hypothetical protein MHMPM18_003876, partial [Marteilia pararefringens]
EPLRVISDFIAEYGTKIDLKSEKNSSEISLNYKFAETIQLDPTSTKSYVESKITKFDNLSVTNDSLTIKFDLKQIGNDLVEQIARLHFFAYSSAIHSCIGKSPASSKGKLIRMDKINQIYMEPDGDRLYLVYAIQTQDSDEDQLLVEYFTTNFKTQLLTRKGVMFSCHKKSPSRSAAAFGPEGGRNKTYYIEMTFPNHLLEADKTMELIVYFHQTIHMNIKSTKTCLNLVNSHYLKQLLRKYNRAKDSL